MAARFEEILQISIVIVIPTAGGLAANSAPFFVPTRQLSASSGFAVQTHGSGEYRSVRGTLGRNRERMTVVARVEKACGPPWLVSPWHGR